ncbi:MAG: tetratricopeptide repeat protein [Myxococcota bacterium]
MQARGTGLTGRDEEPRHGGGDVIHVLFGADGGYRLTTPDADPESAAQPEAPALGGDDPLADLYTREEVARLFGLPEGRLRYWDRSGFVAPSARRGRRRYYTFQDLIGLRAAKGLLDAGLRLSEVRASVEAIRGALPRVVRPLSELRVVAEGRAMLVRDARGTFEPTTGQLVLDFRVDALREDVVAALRRPASEAERRTAYDRYLEGCRLDEDPATHAAAEAAYREALRLDPTLANAFTNLGNLRFRQGDEGGAEALYRQALLVDPQQPEALYNLGFLALDEGRAEEAIPRFERALDADPAFADAHFNLALAYEAVGRHADATPHWQTYLTLEPEGAWAEVAARHLERKL